MENKFEEIFEQITMDIQTLKEDRPNLIVTDDLIEEYILGYMEQLIKEVKEEL